MINHNKILKLQTLSFKNALRLHCDSILLFNNKSFPSAYAMSILALEELGKMYLFDDFLFHRATNQVGTETQITRWLQLMYNHKWKQCKFASWHWADLPARIIRIIESGDLDLAKQNALYVGLPKVRGKPLLKGRINSPFKISETKAAKQITTINDILLELVLGVIKGTYSLEIDHVDTLFTWELYQSLENHWEHRSKATAKILAKLIALEDEPYHKTGKSVS